MKTMLMILKFLACAGIAGFVITGWAALVNVSTTLDKLAETMDKVEKDLEKIAWKEGEGSDDC